MHDADDDSPDLDPRAALGPDERDAARWEACEEGVELLREGDVDGAIAHFEAVAVQDAQNAYAFHFLGAAHYEREAWDKALAAYLEALQRAPQYLGARVGAGQTLRMMGQPERAIRMGKQALMLRRDDPDALFLLGLCYYQLGERKPAFGFLQRFLATGPEVEVRLEVEGLLDLIRGEVFPGSDDEEGDGGDD